MSTAVVAILVAFSVTWLILRLYLGRRGYPDALPLFVCAVGLAAAVLVGGYVLFVATLLPVSGPGLLLLGVAETVIVVAWASVARTWLNGLPRG